MSNEADRLYEALLRDHRIDPEAAASLLEAAARLDPTKRKGFQAALLRQTFRDAASLAAACGWDGVVVLRKGEALVDQDGVLLRTDVDGRFFRKKGRPQAAGMLRELAAFGVVPRVVFDVGANIGEIAIYMARHLPAARVFAFEPGPENLAAFELNLAEQPTLLANLELIPEAVGDRTGDIAFIAGAGDLDTMVLDANLARLREEHGGQVIQARSDTLENHCERLGVERIDFLKVDIEGGEPALAASIARMRGRVGAALVEMSRYNSVEAYMNLVEAFRLAGLRMLHRRAPVEDAEDWLTRSLSVSTAVNVWFVPEERLPR